MDGGEHLVIGAATAGLALWGLRAVGAGLEPVAILAGAAVAGVGALAPDIDHPRSTLSKGLRIELLDMAVRLLVLPAMLLLLWAVAGDLRRGWIMTLRTLAPFLRWGALLAVVSVALLVTSRVASAFGHRGATHSLVFMTGSTALAVTACAGLRVDWWYGLAFGFGWLTHLLADASTEVGLPSLLWPFANPD